MWKDRRLQCSWPSSALCFLILSVWPTRQVVAEDFPSVQSISTTGTPAQMALADMDENGVTVTDDPEVWTGTLPFGAAAPDTCDGWTSEEIELFGEVGLATAMGAGRLKRSGTWRYALAVLCCYITFGWAWRRTRRRAPLPGLARAWILRGSGSWFSVWRGRARRWRAFWLRPAPRSRFRTSGMNRHWESGCLIWRSCRSSTCWGNIPRACWTRPICCA